MKSIKNYLSSLCVAVMLAMSMLSMQAFAASIHSELFSNSVGYVASADASTPATNFDHATASASAYRTCAVNSCLIAVSNPTKSRHFVRDPGDEDDDVADSASHQSYLIDERLLS